MANKRRRTYDAEFKRQAVELADSPDRNDDEVERELGLYDGAIRTWRRAIAQDAETAFPGHGHLPAPEEELRRLRRELHILQQEREILKKAVAIFSHPPKNGTDS
ncbi:MAG: transposase [Bacteroidota bacterium]|jgi:transposase|nr:transposase [Bacteroidota bacterium]